MFYITLNDISNNQTNYDCSMGSAEPRSVCASLLFGFEGGVWDLIVLNPDHCFSIYLVSGSKEDALTLLNG